MARRQRHGLAEPGPADHVAPGDVVPDEGISELWMMDALPASSDEFWR